MMEVWFQHIHTYAEVDLAFFQLRHVDSVHGGRRCTAVSRLAGVSARPIAHVIEATTPHSPDLSRLVSAAMGQQGSQLLNDMEQNTHCRLV